MSTVYSFVDRLLKQAGPDFRLNGLASAEVNYTPLAPQKLGLSLFFPLNAEWEAFRAAVPLPECALFEESALREKYDFVERRWIKLHYDGATQVGLSQYLQIRPDLNYPITTLRRAFKGLGVTDVRWIEDVFEPALERDDSVWAVILKREGSGGAGDARPRLSVYTDRALLPDLLNRLVAAGKLSAATASGFASVDSRMKAGDHAYLSLDLTDSGMASIDYEKVEPISIPSDIKPLLPHYLKCRFVPGQPAPVWSWYAPLTDLLDARDLNKIQQWRQEAGNAEVRPLTERARTYYDQQTDNIVKSVGLTYQAGVFPEKTPQEMNTEWAKRAGIQSGERILDAGCGAGGPAVDMAKAVPGALIDGVTISREQANVAKAYAQKASVQDRVTFRVADYHKLPFTDSLYDRAVFLESVGYSSDLPGLFREIFRVVRPGGTLFVKDVFRPDRALTVAELLEVFEFDHVYSQQTPTIAETLAAIQAAGFTDVKYTGLGDELTTEGFYRGMFEKAAASPLAEFGLAPMPDKPGPITAFGLHHLRGYDHLPLTFGQILARRP